MKSKALVTLVVIFLSSISLFSQNDTVTFTNEESVSQGTKKEFITCNQATNTPIKRIVQIEDLNGNLIEKTQYAWTGNEWRGVKRSEYKFDSNSKLSSMTSTTWDNSNRKWAKQSDQITYEYDNDGNLAKTESAKIKTPMIS